METRGRSGRCDRDGMLPEGRTYHGKRGVVLPLKSKKGRTACVRVGALGVSWMHGRQADVMEGCRPFVTALPNPVRFPGWMQPTHG